MYYSLTFSYDKPKRPLYFGMDNRTYFNDLYFTDARDDVKNTWNDWHLVPTQRPSITPPEVKTKMVEIPGMNGDLDLTESLTGYPAYNNREGSITFKIINDYEHWHEIYADMCSYLNGRVLYFAMEDDPAYFYHGRITVENYDSQKDNSEITINYVLDPQKYEYVNGHDDGWWDVLDFEVDYLGGIKYTNKFLNFQVDSDDYITLCSGEDWGNFTEFPVIPEIVIDTTTITDNITIHFVNKEVGIDFTKTLQSGTYKLAEIIFTQLKNRGKVFKTVAPLGSEPPYTIYESEYKTMGYQDSHMDLYVKGHGTITFNFNTGRK